MSEEPTRAVSDCNTTYAMIKSGPDLSVEESELGDVVALEVMVLWGTSVLHVSHHTPPRAFYVGERTNQEQLDFVLPAHSVDSARWPLVVIEAGVPHVVIPAAASVTFETSGSAERTLEQLGNARPSTVLPGARSVPLTKGARVEVTLGDLRLAVAAVNAGKPVAKSLLGASDRSAVLYFGLALLTHAAIIGTMAFFTPALGLTDEESLDSDRLYAIQQYLDASAERERKAEEENAAADDPSQGPSGASEAARGASGKMGKQNAPLANKRTGVKGPSDNPDPHLARESALREAREFGVVGILGSLSRDPSSLTVPWGRDRALGTDPLDALGNMWGEDIGEAGGSGGLGLSGIGEMGGGRGAGVGLDAIGTCGGALCPGLVGGFGNSFGRRGPEHKTRAPGPIRTGTLQVGGHLAPEVIQRVVRQNFGRFRQCYETGLRSNPNLEGRVAVRFVIGRDGSVSNTGNGGSDLPDSAAVSCVISAFYGLSFPPPEDGIVSVVYPIMFSPG